ncbi:hypothetical protein ACD661_12105 [Legionella lytica]|uniref:Uncharacterized protein n=1 Tax=Legionella lytica TaxID=96232 RepID=A0ABW8D9B0_9GAMM
MHYSDCYKYVKNIKNKDFAKKLEQDLKNLELEANNPNFADFLKENKESGEDIFALRKKYDLMQLEKVVNGIHAMLEDIDQQAAIKNEANFSLISLVLKDIQKTAHSQINKYDYYVNNAHYYDLAKKYATHYIPFNQSNDPFKGSDFRGYCWGHTHEYGKLASEGRLEHLTQASSKKLYNTYQTNFTLADIFFRRVGWYFSVQQEQKMRDAIWNALKDLDEKAIFNFNFLTSGFHSTGLRMVGDHIEYYENNYGIVRFDTREDAVNFLAGHLLHEAQASNAEVNFITVYKLPYENDPKQDLFSGLTDMGCIQKPPKAPKVEHSEELEKTITALREYGQKLNEGNGIKGKIKANEITFLVEELDTLPAEEVKERVEGILKNKNHSLILNRGTGLYYIGSKMTSHSTTETLLQNISKSAKSNTLDLKSGASF